MADTEAPQIRQPEQITFSVIRARHLKGSSSKADVVNSTIKVEFGEKTLGESPKVDCTPDTPAEFNYNVTLNCTYDDPTALDELSYKPIVLTVIEVLPKEKKQKEEKTVVLGQCTVDLLPLVKGETKHKYTLTVNAVPGSPLETLAPDAPRPEIDVGLSVNEPLLDVGQLNAGNLMTVTMETLFAPPESWTITGTQYAFAAALPVPVNGEKETPVVFANGHMKPGADKEPPNRQKKWAVPGTAQANAVYMADQFIASDAIEDEDGDYKNKDDREHRTVSEMEKNRVTWNTERRSYLEGSAAKNLQDKIAKCRYWPVEVFRLPQPAGSKGKKDEDGSISYHGVAFVNLAPLLYPGVKRIRGAYKVHAYTDQALHEKTKRKSGLGEEAAKIANNILNRSSASPTTKKGGKEKDDAKGKDVKKGRTGSVTHHDIQTSQTIKSDAGSEIDAQAPVNVEGQQYVDAKSYIMIEISLTRPLIPKRPPEELARRVAEYIPPRPLFPKRTDGAQRSEKRSVSECRVTVLQGGSSQGTTGGGSMCCKVCSAVQTETMKCYASTVTKQSEKRSVSECRVTVLQGGSSQGTTGGGSMCCKVCSAVQTETMKCYASTVTKQSEKRSVSECRVTVLQGGSSQGTTGGGSMCCKVCSAVQTETMKCYASTVTKQAVEDFHTQVSSVAGLVLDEFRDLFGEEIKSDEPQSTESMEARRQKLIYELNSSGKYFAFKEQLKHSVVKIVREKYLKTTNFEDRQELQTFLSELYVYLIDQMHESLGKCLSLEDQAPVPSPLTDSAQLKHFAREAEVNENFELATKYYQERIARNKNDPSHWFDYGTFCLYINDITKAEECFKECVAIDQKHLHGLLLYGVVCTLLEKHDVAETFFEAATCVQPRSILAWTMLGLFYDAIQNEIGAEMAYMEANKLNQSAAVAMARAIREEELAKERRERGETDETESDGHKDDQGGLAPPPSNTLVADPKQPTPPPSDRGQGSARSSEKVSVARRPSASKRSSGGRQKSESNLSRPSSQYRRDSARGTPQPEESSEDIPPREPTPVPTASIFMQAIDWLLEVKAVPFTERALAHELLSPVGGPTAQYHISLARVKLQKRALTEAEDSLNEALQFDYQNPDAWALMGHVKYLLGDTPEARDCYERTISFLADASEMHSIYLRLASIYLQEARFQEAKHTFLKACKRSPSCVSWLGVGIACYRLNELTEAEDALSEANILNNSDPEVWGYLSLVCLKTGRQLESEQAYKYAIKVNLCDPDLLDEIIRVQQEVGFGNPQF